MSTQFDACHQRLVMHREAPTAEFWDNLWQTDDFKQRVEADSRNSFYVGLTRRFLAAAPKVRVLDGGCGQGAVVLSHQRAGYDAYGVDFAASTVKHAQQALPELKLTVGDVTQLPFPDNFFDAYWSLGVIEHFFDGYDRIIAEAQRVLKPSGYLFLTFPHLNLLRQLKIKLGAYEQFPAASTRPADFYQFILHYRTVQEKLEQYSFRLRYRRPVDGFKGLSNEIPAVRPVLHALLRENSRLAQLTGAAITEAAAPVAGHIMLLAMQSMKR